jgi:hypothetical protein
MDPFAAAKVPARQALQFTDPFSANVPAGQGEQDEVLLCAAYEPAGHKLHADEFDHE